MRLTILFVFLSVTQAIGAIGHLNKTFNDPARSRDIETDLYYPAATAGDNVPVTPGSYPLLVWGHGFLMDVGASMNVVNALVDDGYIVALPKTEGGFLPNHEEFAKDLLFLMDYLTETENTSTGSILFESFSGLVAIGGHSMGGGCSVLAGELGAGNIHLKTIVNFGAADTNPSSINAAAGVTVPVLLFAGGNDCVTPIAEHQQPIFNNLSSTCKALVTLNGGSHCFFADDNTACSLGELICNPAAEITREEQHARTFSIMKPWLDIYLKGAGAAAVTSIQQTWNNNAFYQTDNACSTLSAPDLLPLASWFRVGDGIYSFHSNGTYHYTLHQITGALLYSGSFTQSIQIDLSSNTPGVYLFTLYDVSGNPFTYKLIR